MRLGLESLNDAPRDDEERREQFNLKRQIVLALVDKVKIDKNRQMKVIFRVDVKSLLNRQLERDQVQPAGIYTRKRSCRARRRPGAGGG